MADELLSCPFCGGEARPDAQTHMGRNYVGIICLGCGLWQDTRSPDIIGAIAAWNRRTPPTPATDTQEESMKLGGGTANGMRALGYQVLPPEPNSDSTCWRMIAPQSRNTEYLAADQAEGWRKAEKHWHARNLENVFRRTPPTPATDECTCFGDSGMQASTFCRSDDVRCCDLCGKPVASTPPTPITEEREAVARAYQAGAEAVHKAWVDCGGNCPGDPDFWEAAHDYADANPIRSAEILAAERERDALLAALTNPPKHVWWGAGEPDCPPDIVAGNGALHTLRCKVCGKGLSDGRICLAGIVK